jgi:hypothetical protein
MCKFESKNSPGYTAVSANVKRFAMDAPAKIAANWDRERASIEERRRRDAMELLGARKFSEPTHAWLQRAPF